MNPHDPISEQREELNMALDKLKAAIRAEEQARADLDKKQVKRIMAEDDYAVLLHKVLNP